MTLRAEVNRMSGETHHIRVPCRAFCGIYPKRRCPVRDFPDRASLYTEAPGAPPAVSFGFL
ncbi:hypothetical protein HMPREF1546_01641 [Oscillibacter sp. KLE 1745]|nr:hypothetical protein HMPREF1546_01641 [Oscillibacter sp. KLE 1745]